MNNQEFNTVLAKSYKVYLGTSPRSNKKLVILHGAIAEDLQKRLGKEYDIKALGIGEGKEAKISGRYLDKTVDISIFKNKSALGGIAVKYIMSNYSQNSNNYFENMLGETANIRCANKAYFQIIILPKYIPYYKKDGTISNIEEIKEHNIDKYTKLSQDNIGEFFHAPTKTLFCLINVPCIDLSKIRDKTSYANSVLSIENFEIALCADIHKFEEGIIYNDYNKFIEKVINYIKFIEK